MNLLLGIFVLLNWMNLSLCQQIIFPDELNDGKYTTQTAQPSSTSSTLDPFVENALLEIFGTSPGNNFETSTAFPTVPTSRRPFSTTPPPGVFTTTGEMTTDDIDSIILDIFGPPPTSPQGIKPTIGTTTTKSKPFPTVPSKTTRKPFTFATTSSPDYGDDEELPPTTPKRTTPKRRPTPTRTRKPFTTVTTERNTQNIWDIFGPSSTKSPTTRYPDVVTTTKRQKLSDIAFDTIEGIFGLGPKKTTRKPSHTELQHKPTKKPNFDSNFENNGPENWNPGEDWNNQNIHNHNRPNRPQNQGHGNMHLNYPSQQHHPGSWQNPISRPNSDNSHHHDQWSHQHNAPGNGFNQLPQNNHQTHPNTNNNFGSWQRPQHSGNNFGGQSQHYPVGHNQAGGTPTKKPNNPDSYYILGPFELSDASTILINAPSTSTVNANCINGYLRDIYDCSMYYKCLPNGERLKFTCGAHLYFDITTLACYPKIYGIC